MDKGKIFLFGYYGFNNLGDELFVEYYTELIRQRFSGHRLIVLINNSQDLTVRDGVEFISRWDLRQMTKMFNQDDLLIGGGGSIFQDMSSKKSLLYYLTLLSIAQLKKTHIILAGQGFGPLSTAGKFLTMRVLNKVDVISCRDTASVKYLFRIKVNRPDIYLGVDPLWGLKGPDFVESRAYTEIPAPSRAVIGLFLRSEDQGRYKALKQELYSLLNLNFMGVRLLTLAPEDREALRDKIKVSYEVRTPYLSPAVEIRSLKEMAAVCSGLSLVIGERLHGLLLAARLGIPGIGLGGDPKIKAFCREMGYPYFTWDELFYEETLNGPFMEEVEKTINSLSSIRQRLVAVVEKMEKKAREDRIWLIRRITERLK